MKTVDAGKRNVAMQLRSVGTEARAVVRRSVGAISGYMTTKRC